MIHAYEWEEEEIMEDKTPQIHKEDFVLADKQKHVVVETTSNKKIKSSSKVFKRFIKNPSSIVGLSMLFSVLLLAFIPPLASKKPTEYKDSVYSYALPKIDAFQGSGFWDGSYKTNITDKRHYYLVAMGAGYLDQDGSNFNQDNYKNSKYNPITKEYKSFVSEETTYYQVRIDSYYEIGFVYDYLSEDKYQKLLEYQTLSKTQVLYPLINLSSEYVEDENDANFFYYTNGLYPCNETGEFIDHHTNEVVSNPKNGELTIYPNYLKDGDNNLIYYIQTGNSYKVRVFYYHYYQFEYWLTYGGGNYYVSPSSMFGTDTQGYDVLLRTPSGIRLSLLLSLAVFAINFVIGTIYGIIEGYYGGVTDNILFHISEILKAIPFIVLATVFVQHFIVKGSLTTFAGLLIAFILTGWIGVASDTRRQIYRFKNREFVVASRLLGGKDVHIITKHIYPHAISSLITSLVLYIPAIIFNETSLSFLGIVDFNGTGFTSLGTVLANGQACVANFPHVILFPALVISILMIAFNLIGNGLREAFDNDVVFKRKKR